jgi:hypothetical protein
VKNDAFELLSRGDFKKGLRKLGEDPQWNDPAAAGRPLFLGFPGAPGWGEGLLIASLAKRRAAADRKHISACAKSEVCSILKNDPAFQSIESDTRNGRPPLSVLQDALVGDLLTLPFEKIEAANSHLRPTWRPRIGLAWASVNKRCRPIPEKSIPLCEFLGILREVGDAELISFQRRLGANDRKVLNEQFEKRWSFPLSDCDLDSPDQSNVVKQICSLDCMVTISTTTAHIAASLGVPVVLIAAKRRDGQQWFWSAQKEHGACFYPSVKVTLGVVPTKADKWWEGCIECAQRNLHSHLAR